MTTSNPRHLPKILLFSVVLAIFIFYSVYKHNCFVQENCRHNNYLKVLKPLAQSFELELIRYYRKKKHYPEMEEMPDILESIGCRNARIEKKAPSSGLVSYTPKFGEYLIDPKGRYFLDYTYQCTIDDKQAKMVVTEIGSIYTSKYTDSTHSELKSKVLGDLVIDFTMGNFSYCRLIFKLKQSYYACYGGNR